MSRARDKLHILLLSIFLCACILFIVFGLIGERNIEAGQDKMSEVGVRRMNLIVESLAGKPVYTEFTVEPNFAWGSKGAFFVIYTDQDCGVCLYEMAEFTEQISTDHKLPIFSVNRTGEKQLPGDALVHLDYDAIKFNPQLRNVPTPILIYSDGSREIKSGYVSTLFDDRSRKRSFLELVRKTTKK
ncbi:MAG: hypothetical protein F4Y45_10725 [Acidobacteria bacterium]|nr:hypothetical protein [Acidobacteriota bacterium]